MAEYAAEHLAFNAYQTKIEAAIYNVKELGLKFYIQYIPNDVRITATSHINMYETQRDLKFLTEGSSYWEYIQIVFDIEFPRLRPIVLSKEDWKELDKADKYRKELEKESKVFKQDVAQALINLRTEKNIREQFPEALPYLNFTECTALIPNLNNLRKKLNNEKK